MKGKPDRAPIRLLLRHSFSRTTTRHRITCTRSVIDGRRSTLVNGHGNLGCCRGCVASRIPDPESDRVNAPIQISVALGAQLHRLAVRRDHNVVESVTVSAARIVLGLIAADAGNHYTAGDI